MFSTATRKKALVEFQTFLLGFETRAPGGRPAQEGAFQTFLLGFETEQDREAAENLDYGSKRSFWDLKRPLEALRDDGLQGSKRSFWDLKLYRLHGKTVRKPVVPNVPSGI